MSIQAVLWRVVLCISVILNGSALASTAMSMPSPLHQQQLDSMSTDSPSMHSACHEQSADMPVVVAHQHAPSNPPPCKGGHATPDCCATGACGCAFVQAQASIAVARFDSLAKHAVTAIRVQARHDDPELHQLIRPPIGQAFHAPIRPATPCARVIT
jgi:hypothetical protein